MGGGTGTVAVISALKQLGTNIASIVAVSDSGGSTGRIRDEFGFQPVGDLRQSLAALADPKDQEWIQKILLYRFEKGSGLKGHNLGNLILTALQDMTDNTTKALEIAARSFDLQGRVIPVTQDSVELKIVYDDGTSAVGEHILDETVKNVKTIDRVELTPDCKINPTAQSALLDADYIIIGPGDLYASIMAVLVTPGIKEAFGQTKAKVLYISNLMSRITQTHNMTAKEHLDKIQAAIGRKVDKVIINKEEISRPVLEHYASYNEFPIKNDLSDDARAIMADLVANMTFTKSEVDNSYRSFLRHDSNKLKTVLRELFDHE